MSDQNASTDGNGVLLDDETDDPGQNSNTPDPLIGEAPRSGALSAIPAKPVAGSMRDKESRASTSRSQMETLQQAYGENQKALSGAYADEAKALQAARQQLLSSSAYAISPREAGMQLAAAMTHTDSAGRFDPGQVAAAQASIMQQQRSGEIQRQQLLNQYATQIPESMAKNYGAMGNSLIQRMRIAQSDVNNSATAANKPPATHDKYFTQDPNDPTQWIDHPEQRAADEQQARQTAQDKADINLKSQKALQAYRATGMITPEMVDLAFNDIKSVPRAVQNNPAAMSSLMYQVHQRAIAEGNTGLGFYAQQTLNKESGKVLDSYERGNDKKSLDGINTAVSHLDVLNPLIGQLNNGPVAFANYVKNTWNQKVMGEPAPTDFNGVRAFVAGEIAKAVLPQGGGEAERMELAHSAASVNSPEALKSIVDKWQQLLAGKTHYLKFNWDNSTRDPTTGQPRFGQFEDRFLLPRTRAVLGLGAPPPPLNPAGANTPTPVIDPLVAKWLNKPAPPRP
jgi:hypothetical protein